MEYLIFFLFFCKYCRSLLATPHPAGDFCGARSQPPARALSRARLHLRFARNFPGAPAAPRLARLQREERKSPGSTPACPPQRLFVRVPKEKRVRSGFRTHSFLQKKVRKFFPGSARKDFVRGSPH